MTMQRRMDFYETTLGYATAAAAAGGGGGAFKVLNLKGLSPALELISVIKSLLRNRFAFGSHAGYFPFFVTLTRAWPSGSSRQKSNLSACP